MERFLTGWTHVRAEVRCVRGHVAVLILILGAIAVSAPAAAGCRVLGDPVRAGCALPAETEVSVPVGPAPSVGLDLPDPCSRAPGASSDACAETTRIAGTVVTEQTVTTCSSSEGAAGSGVADRLGALTSSSQGSAAPQEPPCATIRAGRSEAGSSPDPVASIGSDAPLGVRPGPLASSDDGPADPGAAAADDPLSASSIRVPDQPGLDAVTLGASTLLVGYILVRLYRRLSGSDLLDNEIRSELVRLARDQPGIHAAAAAERLGVSLTTVLYHVRILRDHDLLGAEDIDGRVRLFDRKRQPKPRRALEALIRNDTRRRVLQEVRAGDGVSLSELARRLDRPKSTVKYHVDRLLEADVVTDRGTGQAMALHLTDVATAGL